MSISVTSGISATVLGDTYNHDLSLTGSASQVAKPTVPAAKTGSLTTVTSTTAGTLTMQAGHGIATGNKIDIYWAGGQIQGATVGTVSGNSVPFSGGTFLPSSVTSIPALNTAVTVMLPTSEPFNVAASAMTGLFLYAEATGIITFVQANGTVITQMLVQGTDSYIWSNQIGTANPFSTTACANVLFSHGDATASHLMRAVATTP